MILAELLALKRADDAGLTAQLTQQLRALMASILTKPCATPVMYVYLF